MGDWVSNHQPELPKCGARYDLSNDGSEYGPCVLPANHLATHRGAGGEVWGWNDVHPAKVTRFKNAKLKMSRDAFSPDVFDCAITIAVLSEQAARDLYEAAVAGERIEVEFARGILSPLKEAGKSTSRKEVG